jgi:hypothetical protein
VRRTLPCLLAAGLVLFGWKKYQERVACLADGGEGDPAQLTVERDDPGNSRYRCDGRVYCSQMKSCEETTWFLQHCPGVKMDGEGDGVPCERQRCGHR